MNAKSKKDVEKIYIKRKKIYCVLNGPISKKTFLKKKFLGITEYIGYRTKSKNPVMLIYNEKLAVSPLTTHVPLNKVSHLVKKNKIIGDITKIDRFYKLFFKKN